MRKRLLLAATLGSLALTPVEASAHGHAAAQPAVQSSFGIRVIVRDGPNVVHHHHRPERHLRPQPWPRRFSHPAPAWRSHGPWHHRPQGFHWRERDHRPWFHRPGAHRFEHGHGKRWWPAPRHDWRPAVRNGFPHGRFKDGHRGFGHRHH
jgi:hypothetical protein